MKWQQAKAVEAPLLLVVLTATSLKVLELAGDQSLSVFIARGIKIPQCSTPPPHDGHPSLLRPEMQQHQLSQQTDLKLNPAMDYAQLHQNKLAYHAKIWMINITRIASSMCVLYIHCMQMK